MKTAPDLLVCDLAPTVPDRKWATAVIEFCPVRARILSVTDPRPLLHPIQFQKIQYCPWWRI